MKYLKLFEGGIPPMSKKAMDSLKKERETIGRLKQSGTQEEVLYYYENLKEKVFKAAGWGFKQADTSFSTSARTNYFTGSYPIPNSIYELKILLKDKFDMDIDDGVDVDKYLEKENKKPFVQRVKDRLKKFGEYVMRPSETEDMGPGGGIGKDDYDAPINTSDWIDKDHPAYGDPDAIRHARFLRDKEKRYGKGVDWTDMGPG